jgi:hypothetical protein
MKKLSAKDALLREIEDLQDQLRDKQKEIGDILHQKFKALSALELAEAKERGTSQKALPYAGMRTWKAIKIYLEGQGELRTIKQVAKAMIDGGAMYGKREWRLERNVQVAITMSKDIDTVGDKVGLSEWFKKGGKYSHLTPDSKNK